MSKIHSMMDVGKRSMMNSQTALQTVGHNIANKSTEGYSRQRVEIQTNEPVGQGSLRLGMGARTASVTRTNNPYLEKQIGKEQAGLGYYTGKNDAMARVEQVYNEQSNRGLNSYVSEFFNAFREFGNSPESLATRTQVKETAVQLTHDFKRINKQLTEIQDDIDQQLLTHVHSINEMSQEIASLNEKIQVVQTAGGTANDERDRRDLLIKKLGEKVNIRWAEGSNGMVTITAGNAALLVSGYEAKTLEVRATPERDNKNEGNFDIFYKNTPQSEAVSVTEQFTGGAVGGLLDVRDRSINELLGEIDSMAFSVGTVVNEIHSRGFDSFNNQGGDFFSVPVQVRHAAKNLDVAERIKENVGRIAAAAVKDSPGDNRVANAISQLQFQSLMRDGTATADEFYNSMVGKVGIETRSIEKSIESQQGIVKQLQNIRESISGVSLDEETTKLIEFQKAYDASARLIRTADEMFDTVLNLKRM